MSIHSEELSGSLQIESKFSLSTKLSVEGPVRMKEEYVEGVLDTPTVIQETIPEQLKGALGQAVNTVQQLPVPIRDALASGLRVPLSEFNILLVPLFCYPNFTITYLTQMYCQNSSFSFVIRYYVI